MKITEDRAEELASIIRDELAESAFDVTTNLLISEEPDLEGDDFWDAVDKITKKI